MNFPFERTLKQALSYHGLSSRPSPDVKQGRILVQNGRDIGYMTASVGWSLIHRLENTSTENDRRCDVEDARQLWASLDRGVL